MSEIRRVCAGSMKRDGRTFFCDQAPGHGGPHDGHRMGDNASPRATWEDTACCRFCGGGFTPPSPEVTFCRMCFYAGRDQAEQLDALMQALTAVHHVEIEHTGGGNFWIEARLENHQIAIFTMAVPDGKYGWVPESVLAPTSAGPWYGGLYQLDAEGNMPEEAIRYVSCLQGVKEAAAFLASCCQRAEVGTRVRFIESVERFPHDIVEVGEWGTVHAVSDDLIEVKLDTEHAPFEEWDNCLQFEAGSDRFHEYFRACQEVR